MSKSRGQIQRTNREYLGYIDKSTKHIYMLSEFIDNAVQSAKDNNLQSVDVKIIINMQKKCIYVIDNAGGIPYSERENAIKNGKDESELGTSLNMFGVGMKMASVWFGKKMTFFTKSLKDNFAYSLELDVDNLEDNDFCYECEEGIDISSTAGIEFASPSGTIIKIEKLHLKGPHNKRYEKKAFAKVGKGEGKSLEEKIACRFSRYIRSKFLSISLSYIDKNGDEEMNVEKHGDITLRTPTNITSDKIPQLFISKTGLSDFEYYKNKNKEIRENINKTGHYIENIALIENKYKHKLDTDIELGGLTLRKIIEKFKNQEDMYYECSIDIKVDHVKVNVPFKFGFIRKSKGDGLLKFNGLSVFQDDRAVVSGPNSKEAVVTWLAYKQVFSADSHLINNRFSGEIDLNDKNLFRLDNNKMEFIGDIKHVVESHIIDLFKKHLTDIFIDLLQIVFHKDEKSENVEIINKKNENFVSTINKNNSIEGCHLELEEFSMLNSEFEIETSAFKITSKDESQYKFHLTYYLTDSGNEYENHFANNSNKIFATDIQDIEGIQLLILYVNKNFIGFNKNIKEKDFTILVYPFIKLIIERLKNITNNLERAKKFKRIFEVC